MKEVLKEHVRLHLVLANKTSASILLAKVYTASALAHQVVVPQHLRSCIVVSFSFLSETRRCFYCETMLYINIPSLKFRGVGALGRVFDSKIIIKSLFSS